MAMNRSVVLLGCLFVVGLSLAEPHRAVWKKTPMKDLEIWLQAEEAYHSRKPIKVTVMVSNRSTDPLLVNKRMLFNFEGLEGELFFDVQDPRGEAMSFQLLITPREPRNDEFVVLKPGHAIQRTVDLKELHKIKRKGTYKVRVTYRNVYERSLDSMRAWMGSVSSDPLTLVVK